MSTEDHQHEWSALWSHFGEYGDHDAHYHICLADDDCGATLVGKGLDCVDGQHHQALTLPPKFLHD